MVFVFKDPKVWTEEQKLREHPAVTESHSLSIKYFEKRYFRIKILIQQLCEGRRDSS